MVNELFLVTVKKLLPSVVTNAHVQLPDSFLIMLVIVCISDEVEEAVASWVEPLVHVTVRSFRLEE